MYFRFAFILAIFGFAELLDNLRPVSPKPGHMERIKTPLGTSGATADEDEQPFRERFLKINVRHITDGQVIGFSTLYLWILYKNCNCTEIQIFF